MALIEGCRHSLTLEIPAADVQAETEKAVETIRAKAHLPGFRPGKAPASLIRSRFQGDIRQEVVEKLVPRALQDATEKENLQIVSRAEYKDLKFAEDGSIKFTAEFEVAPEIELQEVRGLEVEYAEPVIENDDVEKRLAEMREQKAEFVNVDPRPIADGDHVLVDMESVSGTDGRIEQRDVNIEVGHSDTFSELSDALRGAEPGDEREAEITYPENYASEKLAGRTVRFKLTVKMIRRKELPELNDEFAQDLGDFQNIEELREEVRKQMFREREYMAQTAAKNALVDKLVDLHDFPVPESFVDQQVENTIESQLRSMAAQGADVSKIKVDWDKVRAAQGDRARREVKASLLLEKLADREAISVLQEEVDREVQRIAKQEREPVAATRKRLEENGAIRRIASRIRTEKTLNFLFENARKVAPATKSES